MRGRQTHTTALQQHTATYSTVLLFSVTTQIRILNKLCCTVWRNCPSAEDPKQHLFSCQFVMFCIKLCCRASQTLPPPPLSLHVCAPQSCSRFQVVSKDLNEIWTAVAKLPTDFNPSDRLEVQRAGSVFGKQAAIAIASSLGVKLWQNKKQAETA